jgi:iron complex outermembrane receptor protein
MRPKTAASKRVSPKAAILPGCAAAALIAAPAFAQEAPPAAAEAMAPTLPEIVVTAQRRPQNRQDVPISMTAADRRTLEANRIASVTDLGLVAPNMAARTAPGGGMVPAFTLRGLTSYGAVPGTDKQLSIYMDGVYLGNIAASALDPPEIERIEVLRGPQGTLFGRNATIGAISLVTRDPPARFALSQDFTAGNYAQFRSKTRIDTGAIGDFRASISYAHDQRRGDIRNLGAGAKMFFPAGSGVPAVQTSPGYLGDKDQDTVFAAIAYEPSSDFRITGKFDWTGNHYTPAGVAPVGVYPDALGDVTGGFLGVVLATQTTPPGFVTDGRRPDAVNNSFSMPAYARAWGNSLTAQWRVNDRLSFRNILAYRSTYLRANDQLDGLGGLEITPAAAAVLGLPPSLAGSPFIVLALQQVTTSQQWSNEFQANYTSPLLTLTAGALWFHLDTQAGGAPGLPYDVALAILPGGAITGNQSRAYNTATSIAGYAQAELHLTERLDLIGGLRVTHDKRSGDLRVGTPESPVSYPFTYGETEPTFLLGIICKPRDGVLLYGKYATGFVSGGSIGPIAFRPEKARSWEAGIKSDWFGHRLRANLALFDVRYADVQSAQPGINLGHPDIGLAIVNQGDVHAWGAELETIAAPAAGLTFGAALGYTRVAITSLTHEISLFGVPVALGEILPTRQPRWTGNFWGGYEVRQGSNGSRLTFRLDASWRSKERNNAYTALNAIPQFQSLEFLPATWLVNGRVALEDVASPAGNVTLAAWVRNLTNDRSIIYSDVFASFVASAQFQQARTFGLDVSFRY